MNPWLERFALVALALMALLGLAGCAGTLDIDAPRAATVAVAPTLDSPLKTQVAAQIPPGLSGFHLLDSGHAALAARLSLAERATHTLDVQTYLYHNDTTGKLLAATLLAAAERGVRVRMLIDDIDSTDKELGLATLNAHPNIEVRLFNPFRTRGANLLVRGWQVLQDHVRLNRRMHNKVFIADNLVAIAGGRNIGDEYFEAHRDFAFVDLDVLAAGAVVADLSNAFDMYWNSEAAVPASALPIVPEAGRLLRAKQFLADFRTRRLDSDYGRALSAADPVPALLAGTSRWQRAKASLIVDPPEKVMGPGVPTSELMAGQLAGLWINPERRALIVSAYFVPGAMGMAYFRYWRHQGVQVDVLTNAFAASDVPLVHAGYANYRVPLLELGVNLYELKPVAEPHGGRLRDLASGSSRASLHAKAFVLDDKQVFIGSFNFDPRSVHLNTEMGLVIESPELAHQLTAIAEDAMRPERSYRPQLVFEPADGGAVAKRLRWHDVSQGVERVSETEPETTPVQRGLLRVLQALPIEQHL